VPGQAASGRQRLGDLLAEAAELEHALLCQYLYAWFSMKRSPEEGVSWQQLELMRQWGASLLLVARQEMEHLGLVCNLLTAIGEAPTLRRPDFPLGPRHYDLGIPCVLQPFGLPALERFVAFEAPEIPDGDDLDRLQRAGLAGIARNSIAQLYAEIASLFQTLGASMQDLFVGPPGAQFATPTIIPVPIRGVQTPNHPVYDIFLTTVIDLPSALAVIDQIVLEGEGTPGSSPTSHFARFCTMYEQLSEAVAADPAFQPARPVIADPNAADAVTAAPSRAVCELFDSAYAATLLLLYRFFTHADESEAEILALQHAAFFPMMTGVLRPLGELCTSLPAQPGGSEVAAPAFVYPRSIALLPHRRAAWRVMLEALQSLADRAGTLAGDAQSYPPAVTARLTLVHENLVRITSDFAANMRVTP
jgi:hypothetical protein